MLFLVRVQIDDGTSRIIFAEAQQSQEVKSIINDYNLKRSRSRYKKISKITDIKKITGYPNIFEYQEGDSKISVSVLENTIDTNTTTWNVAKKFKLKKIEFKSGLKKYITYFGVALCSIPFMINMIYILINNSFLYYLKIIPVELKVFTLLIFYVGLMIMLMSLKTNIKNNLLWTFSFISFSGLFIMIVFTQVFSQEINGTSMIIMCILWILICLISIDKFLGLIKSYYNKYTNMENKEQVNVTIAIVTFIIGLLIGR